MTEEHPLVVVANDQPDSIAPDGSEVRLLTRTERGSQAQFRLRAGRQSKAVKHLTVDEFWVVVSGTGVMAMTKGNTRIVGAQLHPGTAIAIPVGTTFNLLPATTRIS